MGYGAASSDFSREDTIGVRRAMFGDEVQMTNLGWILSNDLAKLMETTRIGGTESVRFVYEDGMVDCGAQKIPAADTVHLGKAGAESVGILVQKDSAVALIWGGGFPLNALQLPGKTEVEFDIQIEANLRPDEPQTRPRPQARGLTAGEIRTRAENAENGGFAPISR